MLSIFAFILILLYFCFPRKIQFFNLEETDIQISIIIPTLELDLDTDEYKPTIYSDTHDISINSTEYKLLKDMLAPIKIYPRVKGIFVNSVSENNIDWTIIISANGKSAYITSNGTISYNKETNGDMKLYHLGINKKNDATKIKDFIDNIVKDK